MPASRVVYDRCVLSAPSILDPAMPALDHAPPPPEVEDADSHRRARLGLLLFAVYCLLYAGFMGLTAFAPELVRTTPVLGLNLSVTYGFGLIAAALGLAAVYGWLCRTGRDAPARKGGA
jgi:uncharacterized membrane protein (DUF485 family)